MSNGGIVTWVSNNPCSLGKLNHDVLSSSSERLPWTVVVRKI